MNAYEDFKENLKIYIDNFKQFGNEEGIKDREILDDILKIVSKTFGGVK